MGLKIAIGSDHRGFMLKQFLLSHQTINEHNILWKDVGCYSEERCDYPLFARQVVAELQQKKAEYGILLYGTGTGMAIAANRVRGIYAGVVWNSLMATRSKEEDNVNILVLPADFLADIEARACVQAWIAASFKREEVRYSERLAMIDK